MWRRLSVLFENQGLKNQVSSRFNQGLMHKTLDRVHRLNYYAINREVTKYKKTIIEIRPNLQDLLLQLRAEKEGDGDKIEWNFNDMKVKNNQKLLEPVIFHTILSLHNLGLKSSDSNQKLAHERRQYLKNLIKVNAYADYTELSKQLLSDLEFKHSQDPCLDYCLAILIHLSKKGKYDEDDYMGWIQSIVAPTVIEACEHLRNLSDIPSFVVVDIILRTPMLKQEFQLQYDLWVEFLKPIVVGYIDKTSKIKSCFENLIFYCIHHNPQSLEPLISTTISFLTNPKSGCQNSIITPEYINDMLWDLALTSVRDVKSVNWIIKSQELLVKYLGKEPYKNLSLKGYMAIAMAIDSTSPQKALQIFKIAEQRFSRPHSKDLAVYTVVKTYLSATPDDLLVNFNTAATSYSHLTMLWLVFIKKLHEFSLLNETRSIKLIEEMMKYKETLLISKDIIALLIHPIKSLTKFDEFIQSIDKDLLLRYNNIFIPKYISMLFKNPKTTRLKHYWAGEDYITPVEYARYLYQNRLHKSVRNIGIMLQGEAIHSPETVYALYLQELGEQSPDSGCIFAIMRAAMKSDAQGNIITWGDFFAPQVAVHLFKTNTAKLKQDTLNIYPDTRLWQQYIRLLSRYGYLSELSEIIQWWEQIGYKPDSETLILLLNSIPIEHAERYISHYEKVRADSDKIQTKNNNVNDTFHWPWPTHEELKNSTQHFSSGKH